MALTMVLSTRDGVGVHGVEPAGVTTCLRPPWWRSVMGMWTVIDFHCSSEDNFVRSAKPIDASEVSFARKSIAAA
jgi:hypothetical protein